MLPLLLLHEVERRTERQRHAATAAAAAETNAAPQPPLAPRGIQTRRRAAGPPSLASVPEHATAGDGAQEPAPRREARQDATAGGGSGVEAGPDGEQNPLQLEATFLQWCLRPYLYSSLAWSAVALVLHALPMAVEGTADWPAGAT